MGRGTDLVRRLGHQRWFAVLGKHIAPRLDRTVHRLTGGRLNAGEGVLPTLMLIHRGRKSGRIYRTPLAYIRVDDGYGLVASNWGQKHHPAWSGNLLADPDVSVQVHGETIPVRARLVPPAEKAQLWPRFVEKWPAYDTYVERSGRDLRVFVLEPRATHGPP